MVSACCLGFIFYNFEEPPIRWLVNAYSAVLDVHQRLDVNAESLGNLPLVLAPLYALSEYGFTILTQCRSPA